jgi:hypothetical protein
MEEKIYQRQVAKESLAQRVIDEKQMERHFTDRELREMYDFRPDIYDPDKQQIPLMPSDDLLKSLLTECKKWIVKYHEHDSLLENLLNEGLSDEERKAAWAEYEAEKVPHKSVPNAAVNTNVSNTGNAASTYAQLMTSTNKNKIIAPATNVNLSNPKYGWLNTKPFKNNEAGNTPRPLNNNQANNLNNLLYPNLVQSLGTNNLNNSKQTPSFTHVPKTSFLSERNNLIQSDTNSINFASSELNRIHMTDQLTQNLDTNCINLIAKNDRNDENQENLELHTPPNNLRDHSSQSSHST